MAENSKIEWCDHTFNPWEGCTKVSPGCMNCYAEARDQRFTGGLHWGKGALRRRTSFTNWNLPLRWNREAAEAVEDALHDFGEDTYVAPPRPRIFCASLADWLDDEVPIEWVADLLCLIHAAPNLDWLLLTKRPQNWRGRIDAVITYLAKYGGPSNSPVFYWLADWREGRNFIPGNIWIGATVEDQQRADERIPQLLRIPAGVRFLSCEPLLGPVELSNATKRADCVEVLGKPALAGIHWLIAGGESGGNARPMHPDWARSLRDQCAAAGVPFLFKQWGQWAPAPDAVDPCMDDPWCDARYGEFHGGMEWIEACMCSEGGPTLYRVGKKQAGRLLDGREHNEFPEVGR